MSIIVFDRVTKRFGSVLAVDNVSFTVQPGRITGFLGRNGAGKTTSLRMLLGLVQPTAGTVSVFGQRYADRDDSSRRIGATVDASEGHPGHTGLRHLEIIAAASGIPRRRAREVLELVGLGDAGQRRIGKYSTGMRRRLGLAAALIGDPDLLVLDEPTSGLDPEGILYLREFLREFASNGGTVFLSSHVLSEVELAVDDTVVIDGRLLFVGPLEELRRRAPGGRLEEAFFGLVDERDHGPTEMVAGDRT